MSFLNNTDSNQQIITCYFCFETFEIDLGIGNIQWQKY